MRTMIPILALLLPCAALGDPIDPNPNGIGIYADVEGRANQVDLDAGVPMEAYVLVTRAESFGESSFAGCEFSIVIPSNVTIWGWNLPQAGAFTFSDPPDFMIALSNPVPYADVIHVLTLIIVPDDDEPAQFYLQGFQGPGGVDYPRYMDSVGFALYELTPYPGGVGNMAFVINGDIVPGESASWSDLKALYR